MKTSLLSFLFLASVFVVPRAYAADPNGLEQKGLYAITTDVGGKKLAWTLVVPADRPAELIGTNPDKDRVELRPYKAGDKTQMWQIYPEGINPEPSYKVMCKFGSSDTEPNAPVTISRVNGNFAADGDAEFHEKYNAMAIGPNQASTDKFFLITEQADGKFVFQSFLGVKEKLAEKGDKNGWAEVRAVEAVPVGGDVKFRQRPLTKKGGQLWTVTKVGAL
jgi:hypothetical protein